MKRSLIALAAVALSGAVVLPAAAASIEEASAKTVSVAGIDMSTEAGAKIVYQRIENAADRVCGVNSGRMALKQIQPAKACAEKAVEAAVKALNVDTVTAVHNAK
ncbi:MAG: UrcA family protein [Hyphomonas sp.]